MRATAARLATVVAALVVGACSWDLSGYSGGAPSGDDDDDDASTSGRDARAPEDSGNVSKAEAATAEAGIDTNTSGGTCTPGPLPTFADCPAACTGGCANGKCNIECTDASCNGATLNCPTNRACVVACGNSSCKGATINCPATGSCTVTCGGSFSCSGAHINCGSGACSGTCAAVPPNFVSSCGESCGCVFDSCSN